MTHEIDYLMNVEELEMARNIYLKEQELNILKQRNKQNKKPIPEHNVLIQKLKAKFKIYCYSNKFFIYRNNYYQEVAIKAELYDLADKNFANPSVIENAEKLLMMDNTIKLQDTNPNIEPERYINFKNGILDIKNKKLIPHTDKIIFFSKIPYDYNEDAVSTEITDKLIANLIKSKSIDDERKKRDMLLEYLGVVISNVRGLKNFLYIEGVKDTGKSTYCGLIMRLLGSKAYSSIPIKELDENSFYLQDIVGKKANIITETSDTPLKDITTLKKLTGGYEEKISCKIKYAPNAQEITSRAMLIFAGNNKPNLWNSGDKQAFLDRMILITFESPIAEQDKIHNILDKINMEYIIKEAIEGLYRFLDNNKVFTQPEQAIQNRNELLRDADIISNFIEDCDITDKTYKIHTKDLYGQFQLWLQQNACSNKITSNMFTRKLKEKGFKNTKISIKGSVPLSGFIGIKPPNLNSEKWGTIQK